MHGTFRSQIERGTVTTVRFDVPARAFPGRREWPSTLAALLAGCCIAGLPSELPMHGAAPALLLPRQKPEAAPASAEHRRPSRSAYARAVAPAIARVADEPVIRFVLPPATPVSVAIPTVAPQVAEAANEPLPPSQGATTAVTADSPPEPPQLAAAEPPAPAAPPMDTAPVALRPVDIAQISDSELRSLRTPQLHEPGLAVGDEGTLAARVAAMQVTPLPPVRVRDSDRAALLAEAPTRMTVRIGDSALGQVDFRMSDTRTVDVQLAGLLDLLAGHYDAAEFARLRTSAAADAYVSFDQLRGLGLNVRY
ncbi:MAG: hypothetical protein J2O44_05155, partial [Porphyrobacter sp.]|nr:hypothetical protein [Porphyrobacter sp.]